MTSRFWIIAGREEIWAWEKECAECRKRKAKPAGLPKIRVKKPLEAVCRVDVDFAGSFFTFQGRRKPRKKRYLCLFTCFLSRAVHLEVAFGKDTDSFLNAFLDDKSQRLSARQRRKFCWSRHSKSCANWLRNLTTWQEQNSEVSGESTHQTEFQPSFSASFRGVYEIMIKATKRAIYAILASAGWPKRWRSNDGFYWSGGFDRLQTINLSNHESKWWCAADTESFPPRTDGRTAPPELTDEKDFNIKKRWRRIQELVKHFWQSWMREWLPEMAQLSERPSSRRNCSRYHTRCPTRPLAAWTSYWSLSWRRRTCTSRKISSGTECSYSNCVEIVPFRTLRLTGQNKELKKLSF